MECVTILNFLYFGIIIILLVLFMKNHVTVSKLTSENEDLKRRVHENPLTGLLNMYGLEAEANRMFSRVFRNVANMDKRSASEILHEVGLVFIDLDGFKQVNDTVGHWVGDNILRNVANALKDAFRPYDIVAHPHGDEFVVVFEITATCTSDTILKRIEHALVPVLAFHEGVSYTAGYATTHGGARDVKTLINLADQHMNSEKIRLGKRR